MTTASSSATSASSKIQPIACSPLVIAGRPGGASSPCSPPRCCVVALHHGRTAGPRRNHRRRRRPPRRHRAVAAGAVRRRRLGDAARLGRRRCRRRVARVSRRLPGACRRARPRSRPGSASANAATPSSRATRGGARVLRDPFYPLRACVPPTAATAASSPATTSRCSRGSRTRTRALRRAAVRAARRPADRRPRDRSTRSSRTSGVRGRVEGRRVVPYWTARRHRARRAPVAGKELAWVDESGRGVLPRDPGLGPRRAGRRQRDARRLRRPERPPLPLDRPRADRPRRAHAGTRVDAGHPRLGRGATRTSCRRCSTRTRATCSSAKSPPPAPGSLEAAIDGPIGTLGVPLLRERTIAVDTRVDPAGRAGVPRDHLPAVDHGRCSASCWRRTPAARSAAPCAPTSSGASATPPAARPAGCARRAGCGCCGRRTGRCADRPAGAAAPAGDRRTARGSLASSAMRPSPSSNRKPQRFAQRSLALRPAFEFDPCLTG